MPTAGRARGSSATIRQDLRARLIDELHLAVSPVLVGGGEPLLAGLDLPALGYAVREHVSSAAALHVGISRRATTAGTEPTPAREAPF